MIFFAIATISMPCSGKIVRAVAGLGQTARIVVPGRIPCFVLVVRTSVPWLPVTRHALHCDTSLRRRAVAGLGQTARIIVDQ